MIDIQKIRAGLGDDQLPSERKTITELCDELESTRAENKRLREALAEAVDIARGQYLDTDDIEKLKQLVALAGTEEI